MSKINPCIVDLGAAVFDILKKSLYVTCERKKDMELLCIHITHAETTVVTQFVFKGKLKGHELDDFYEPLSITIEDANRFSVQTSILKASKLFAKLGCSAHIENAKVFSDVNVFYAYKTPSRNVQDCDFTLTFNEYLGAFATELFRFDVDKHISQKVIVRNPDNLKGPAFKYKRYIYFMDFTLDEYLGAFEAARKVDENIANRLAKLQLLQIKAKAVSVSALENIVNNYVSSIKKDKDIANEDKNELWCLTKNEEVANALLMLVFKGVRSTPYLSIPIVDIWETAEDTIRYLGCPELFTIEMEMKK